MSDSIYACYSCPKVFKSATDRDTSRPCPTCRRTATYLCPEDQWQELDHDAKVALFNEHMPKQDAKLDTNAADARSISAPGTDTIPLILGLFGAAIFALVGFQMLGITSQAAAGGGDYSIMEAFYHTMGWFSFGMAALSATVGYMGWKK